MSKQVRSNIQMPTKTKTTLFRHLDFGQPGTWWKGNVSLGGFGLITLCPPTPLLDWEFGLYLHKTGIIQLRLSQGSMKHCDKLYLRVISFIKLGVGDHPFKTSTCLREEGCPHMPMARVYFVPDVYPRFSNIIHPNLETFALLYLAYLQKNAFHKTLDRLG